MKRGSTTPKVTTDTVSQIGPGSLIKAYDRIEKTDVNKLTADTLELQFAISRELEQRGWELDEENEWTYYL
jgi:hypothetical protein